MIGEFSIEGVFIPAILAVAVTAFVATLVARRVLKAAGAYRFVWHAGLFDVAMFVVLWWLVSVAGRGAAA